MGKGWEELPLCHPPQGPRVGGDWGGCWGLPTMIWGTASSSSSLLGNLGGITESLQASCFGLAPVRPLWGWMSL